MQDISAKSEEFSSKRSNNITVTISIIPMTSTFGEFCSKAVYSELDGEISCDHFISNTLVNFKPTHVEMERNNRTAYICKQYIPKTIMQT